MSMEPPGPLRGLRRGVTALGGSSPKPQPLKAPPTHEVTGGGTDPNPGLGSELRIQDLLTSRGTDAQPRAEVSPQGPALQQHHGGRTRGVTSGSPHPPRNGSGLSPGGALTSRVMDPHPRRGCHPRGRDRGLRCRGCHPSVRGSPHPRGRRGGPGASRGLGGGGFAHPAPLPLPPPPPSRAGRGRFQPVPARPPARPRARRTLTSGACWRAGGGGEAPGSTYV